MLDENTAQFRATHANFEILTTRQKALALVRWLRLNNLTGIQNPERNYRNLRNCLIGQALRHEDHESIPIVSSAIFCCIAARLGMDARFCAFPSHVHALVYAEPGQTLDNLPTDMPQDPPDRMFLDPYGNDDEVPLASLKDLLVRFGWQANMDIFLAPVSSLTITMRTAQNLKATLSRILELQDNAHPELSQLMRGDNAINVEACLYSAMWASLMLTPSNTPDWLDRLANFLRRFAGSWPEDAWLVEQYLRPIYESLPPSRQGFPPHANQGMGNPWEHWRLVREQDGIMPLVSRRKVPRVSMNTSDVIDIPFKIGHVFRHRRYGWIGAITGWSDRGARRLSHPQPGDVDISIPAIDGLPTLQRRSSSNNHCYFTCL